MSLTGITRLESKISSVKEGFLTEKKVCKIFNTKNCLFLIGPKTRWKLRVFPEARNIEIALFENEHVVKLILPKDKFGPFIGCNWKVPFRYHVDKATLSYKVFFHEDFDFVKGGKLPGLAGGAGNSGGFVPNGYDGWSVRFMFKEAGTICAYLYYPGMPEQYGEKKFLKDGSGMVYLKTGAWNSIILTVIMNHPEKEDGIVSANINGVDGLALDTICFRRTSDLKIDHLMFSCLMGGADISYAPGQDQYLLFKDFMVKY